MASINNTKKAITLTDSIHMQIGQLGYIVTNGKPKELVLRCYGILISLENPAYTWLPADEADLTVPTFKQILLLEPGERIILEQEPFTGI